MQRFFAVTFVGCALVFASAANLVFAVPVTINNASFENVTDNTTASAFTIPLAYYLYPPAAQIQAVSNGAALNNDNYSVDNWTYGPGNANASDAHLDNSNTELTMGNVSGNNNVLLTDAGHISQALGAVLQAGTYVLQADLGSPGGSEVAAFVQPTGQMELLFGGVNGTQIGMPVVSGTIGTGTLQTVTFTYTIGALDPNLGQALTVAAFKTDAFTADHESSMGVDNVRLSFTAPAVVPEPSTLLLAAIGAAGTCLIGRRQRRRK